MKELCNCGKIATWLYMPGFADGGSPFLCDCCVPRGCDCNHRYVDVNAYHPPLNEPELPDGIENEDWKWIEINKIWEYIDDMGRSWPCAEYDYDENGFDLD